MSRLCWNFPNKLTFVLRQLWKISTSRTHFGKAGVCQGRRGGSGARSARPRQVPRVGERPLPRRACFLPTWSQRGAGSPEWAEQRTPKVTDEALCVKGPRTSSGELAERARLRNRVSRSPPGALRDRSIRQRWRRTGPGARCPCVSHA